MHFAHGVTALAAVTGVLSFAMPPIPGPNESCISEGYLCLPNTISSSATPCCDGTECIYFHDTEWHDHYHKCLPPPPGWTTPSVIPEPYAWKTTTTIKPTSTTATIVTKTTLAPRGAKALDDDFLDFPIGGSPKRDIKSSASLIERDCGCTGSSKRSEDGIESSASLIERDCGCTE